MTTTKIQTLERGIKKAQAEVDLAKSLERLGKNKDFQRVIEEAYFEKEAVRLVHLRTDQNVQSPDTQMRILRDMDGISALHAWFLRVVQAGQLAEKKVLDDSAEIDLLNEEGAE